MNLHEYQAKELFKQYKIPVPLSKVINNRDDAEDAFCSIGRPRCVVKAQIHAGGRGKAGGIITVESPEQAKIASEKLLGTRLKTYQTKPEGQPVNNVLIEECLDIKKEYYLGAVLDRKMAKVVLMASEEGGVEIEEVARRSPHKIIKENISVSHGILPFQVRRMAYKLNLTKEVAPQFIKIASALFNLFVQKDLSLIEINPLVLTEDSKLIALDAKINVDDRGLYRHPDIEKMRDISQEDPLEYKASVIGVSYVSLDGNIGCLVNGAGLAMSTMDIVKYHGSMPANFLDVGGGASKEQIVEAFKLLFANPNVKSVLINIFGGILRCDILAQGIVDAAKEVKVEVPIVVRLEGTLVEEGRKILASSGLKIIPAENMTDGAVKSIKEAGQK